ncbi:MAG: TerB family tellurite resistance protein [Candidatus Eisenbacteria bacterium]
MAPLTPPRAAHYARTNPIQRTCVAKRARYLLRVLAAVAWSDGELAPEEEAFLRDLGRDLALEQDEQSELDRLLAAPASRDDFERYTREFEQHVDSADARRELLDAVERLIAIDRVRKPEELDCLGHLRDWLAEVESSPLPTTGGVLERLRGGVNSAWRTVGAPLAWAEKMGRNVAQLILPGSGAERVQTERRDFVTLFGALLSRVIDADGVVRPEERAAVRDALGDRFGLSESEIEFVLRLIAARAAEGADRQRLCAEFNRVSSPEQRLELLRALFAAARADGAITNEEEAEARLIANYLWIETQDYTRVRREAGWGATA